MQYKDKAKCYLNTGGILIHDSTVTTGKSTLTSKEIVV